MKPGNGNGQYHPGSVQDMHQGLGEEEARQGVFLVGLSLGGNIPLNCLAVLPIGHRLIGAATISAPIEPLEACWRAMTPRNALDPPVADDATASA